jgi:putative SOS response-associated peptidase YedK
MCGRYSLGVGLEDLCRFFDIPLIASLLEPRFNIAPTQGALVVRSKPADGAREIALLKWGLVPFWAKDTAIGSKLINARSETAAEKPSFRDAFRKRRCLIPTTGFYEWQRRKGGKQPFHIRMKGGGLFAMAGLWERWEKSGEPLETCTILTTEPNELMAPIHDRMPVILSSADFPAWLGEKPTEPDGLRALLKPHASDAMEAFPVQTIVNNPRNESPDCLLPFE